MPDQQAPYGPAAAQFHYPPGWVRHVRLHDGRHTAANLLLGDDVHPRVVMALLGHSQMRTTMDVHGLVMLAREAADGMRALFAARSGRPTAAECSRADS